MSEPGRAWILTGSLENFRIYVERGFDVIGFKERRRLMAAEVEPGDEVIFYVTKSKELPASTPGFGAIARVTSGMFEDRTPIWPAGEKKYPEEYPWRVEAEPVLVLPEEDFVLAAEVVGELEHASKWPAEHWHLAFQGQLRAVVPADRDLLHKRMTAVGAPSRV